MNENNNDRRRRRPDIGFYIFILLILVATVYLLAGRNTASEPITYSEMIRQFTQGNVSAFEVRDDTVSMQLREPINGHDIATHKLYSFSAFYTDLNDIIQEQLASGTLEKFDYVPNTTSWLISLIPYIIILAVMAVLWFFMLRGAAGGAVESAEMLTALGYIKAK